MGGIILLKTIITSAITSIIAFLLCDILLKRWLVEPWARYQALKERVAYCLSFYQSYYTNPITITPEIEQTNRAKQYIKAREDLRDCSAQLQGFAEVLPKIHFGIPSREYLIKASEDLLILSFAVIDSVWERMEDTKTEDKKINDAVSAITASLKIKSKSQANEVKS